MNDEVKEILEALDSTACCTYHNDMCKKAKNYITNLQEENERLTRFKYNISNNKTTSVPTIVKSYKNEYEEYKSRCEKADKFIMSKHNWYGDEEEDNEEYLFELEDFEELLNIINGGK